MKTIMENIRHYVCGELLLYRSIYNIYINYPFVNDEQLEYMHKHCDRIRFICELGLISTDTYARVYNMYIKIRYERGGKQCQSVTN